MDRPRLSSLFLFWNAEWKKCSKNVEKRWYREIYFFGIAWQDRGSWETKGSCKQAFCAIRSRYLSVEICDQLIFLSPTNFKISQRLQTNWPVHTATVYKKVVPSTYVKSHEAFLPIHSKGSCLGAIKSQPSGMAIKKQKLIASRFTKCTAKQDTRQWCTECSSGKTQKLFTPSLLEYHLSHLWSHWSFSAPPFNHCGFFTWRTRQFHSLRCLVYWFFLKKVSKQPSNIQRCWVFFRFRVPLNTSTKIVLQFEIELSIEIVELFGFGRLCSTTYHP